MGSEAIPGLWVTCRWCGGWFCVCLKHYRGQAYCRDECRKRARLLQKRAAQRTYLEKLKGKKRRARVARAYRKRQLRGHPPRMVPQKIVIDQGLPILPLSQEAHPRIGVCIVCSCAVRWFGDRR